MPPPPGRAVPPRYSTLSVDALPLYPSAREYDVSSIYDTEESLEAFEFCLESSGGPKSERRPWATLRLLSKVPAKMQRPRYTSGEEVRGSVLLDLKKPQTVRSIAIYVSVLTGDAYVESHEMQLRGTVMTSSMADSAQVFLEEIHPLWDEKSGIPPSRPAGYDNQTTQDSPNSKFVGEYEFEFSFPFPATFSEPTATRGRKKSSAQPEERKSFATPQTLLQRGISLNIVYDIILKIDTGGAFSSKQR